MEIKRFIYNSRKFSRRRYLQLKSYFGYLGWTWPKAIALSVLVLVCIALLVDTSKSISRAWQNYKLLEAERVKLEEIKAVSEELDHELDYYSSLEYRQRYAYDSLNLAREGERLYSIDLEARENYYLQEISPDPIKEEEPEIWWNLLAGEITSRLVK